MNILYIITKSEIGGAQKFVYEQISVLNNDLEYKLFLCTNENGWLTEKTVSLIGTNNILLSKDIESAYFFSFLVSLVKFIFSKKIDLIICNSANGGLYGRIAGLLTSTKTIYVSHGWSSIYNGGRFQYIYNKIELFLSFISSSIWCISETDKTKAVQIIGISPRKIKVIPNSILPLASNIIKNFNIGKVDFVTVCRLAPPKRVDLLIESMKLLPNHTLHIFGDGQLRNELENLAAKNSVYNVTFMGEVPSFAHFDDYNVFCLISDSEGLPISGIEALSFGMPIVISNVGGCQSLIRNNGYLIKNEIQEIANALSKALERKFILSENSFTLYNEKFNLLKNISLIKAYFKETLLL